MILRCLEASKDDPTRMCDGFIGGAPDGAVIGRIIAKAENAHPDAYGMKCWGCKRVFEVWPPAGKMAA